VHLLCLFDADKDFEADHRFVFSEQCGDMADSVANFVIQEREL
jgi:hypothetical protein